MPVIKVSQQLITRIISCILGISDVTSARMSRDTPAYDGLQRVEIQPLKCTL